MQIAKKLIDASFACSWDCVKFQKRNPDVCVPENQKSVKRNTPWGEMTYLDYRYRVEFEKVTLLMRYVLDGQNKVEIIQSEGTERKPGADLGGD